MSDPVPVISDQYTVARVYFGSLMGLVLLESLLVLPQYAMAKLRKGYVKGTPAKHNKLVVLFHKFITQPSPVPFLTAHNYPMYARFLVFAGLNVLFGYNRARFTSDFTLYGWLTLANAGMTLVLSPRGSNLLSLILRVPTPILLTYHRWCGFACVVHSTLHMGLTLAHNARTGQITTVFENEIYQAGITAWSSLIIVFLTSLRPVRRMAYEVFYYSHFFFLVFSIAAMYHAIHGPEFFLPGLSLWLVDRVWRMRHWFLACAQVESVEHYDGGVTKITVAGVKAKAAGQIAWVNFPAVSKIVWHPFTIASGPGAKGATFAIRGLGGFTKKLNRLDTAGSARNEEKRRSVGNSSTSSSTSSSLTMKVDGPHGVGAIRWGHHALTVLVAGGIGITPGISIASHIVNTAVSPTSPFSSRDGASKPRHIHLLWVLKDLNHANWFAAELSELAALAASTDGRVTLDVTIHYTTASPAAGGSFPYSNGGGGATVAAPDRSLMADQEETLTGGSSSTKAYEGPGTLIQGRPDIFAWFARVRDARRGMDAAVNLCGPRRMIDTARKAAAKASWEGGLFEVEEEVFEF